MTCPHCGGCLVDSAGRLRIRRRAAGQCVDCGAALTAQRRDARRWRCATCQDRVRNRVKAREGARRGNGRCIRCTRRLRAQDRQAGYTRCASCRQDNAIYSCASRAKRTRASSEASC